MANIRVLLVALIFTSGLAGDVDGQRRGEAETVVVPSGALKLRALLWRPRGHGPFPAVVFNHGSGHGVLDPSGQVEHTMEWQARVLGPVFARHGYVFLYPFRRGTGPSAGQGESSSDRWERAMAASGRAEQNRLQIQLLESVEFDDALAALATVRALRDVDAGRVAVAGHSFGGSLTLLVAERDSALRAAIVFSGSARSWPLSPPLRERLLKAADHTVVPVFLIFAANDYSVTPGEVLAAEMTRLGKPHRLKIYPAVGHTAQEGHGFVHLRVTTWEPDVFAFLDPLMR
jgi:dienelactone hydrolase